MNLLALCVTVIINHTPNPLSKYDLETLEHAKTRCVFYYPKSPCLSKFEIKGPRRYWATCSKEPK